MTNLISKIVVLTVLIILTIYDISISITILPIIIVVAICCFLEYFENEKLSFFTFLAYILVCFFSNKFLYFLPAIFYDLLFTKRQYYIVLCVLPLIVNSSNISVNTLIVLIIVTVVEMLLKHKTIQLNKVHRNYIMQRDNLTEKSLYLENKIKELTIKQDDEVNLATLNERNRIAREIHDNVGHLLSSSILQIGAIIATTNDESTKKSLESVKSTLNDGMDSIRNSVHNLRDNSIDLYIQLNSLIEDFKFCEASLKYEANSNFNIKTKYAIISIVKEALSNIIKHSNATEVTVSIYEHPKIVQLIILDNGDCYKELSTTGMGIESIKQRVNNLKGILNIDNSNGFRIFISFNKEDII